MAIRMILVGVVASLGFDLPTGRDVEVWASTGQAWYDARVSEFQARQAIIEGEGIPTPEAIDPEEPIKDEDQAFAAVVEEMVSAFVADQAWVAQVQEEAVPVAGDSESFGNELADALNRWADGLSVPVEPAPVTAKAAGIAIAFAPLDLVEEPLTTTTFAISDSEADQAFRMALEIDSTRSILAALDLSDAQKEAFSGESEKPEAQASRVSEAVQLTGQALKAWLTLLQPGTASASLAH